MDERYERIPDDLIQVAERLTAARPKLDPERLARSRKHVLTRARAARGRGAPAERLWRPRLVLTGMLVLGIMLSTAGVGLAISGLAANGSAGKAQYGNPGGPPPGKPPTGRGSHSQLSSSGRTGARSTAVNATGQTKATSEKSGLPFTGLAAIPLIVAGVALLITGIGLRRRTKTT